MLLNIVTPERRTFSDSVDQVVLPGSEGEMGVLPGHAALVTTLKPGELRYLKDGQETSLAVGKGLLRLLRRGLSAHRHGHSGSRHQRSPCSGGSGASRTGIA
ncbi:MAG: F0F1 ATP synthase subunit epsilon [Verrucomicrobiales bacterium]